MNIEPDADTIEWWRSRIRAMGDKLIAESGSTWEDIPGDLCEVAVVDMLCLLEAFGYDLDRVIEVPAQHDADRDLRWKLRRIASMGSDLERLLSDVRQIVEADDE